MNKFEENLTISGGATCSGRDIFDFCLLVCNIYFVATHELQTFLVSIFHKI